MKMLRQIGGLAVIGVTLLLAGCAGNEPVRYSGIDSASKLTANTDNNADRMPYRYSPLVDWLKYDSIIIDPVRIYQGNDGQFDDMAQADRQTLAAHMQQEFSKALSARLKSSKSPRRIPCV